MAVQTTYTRLPFAKYDGHRADMHTGTIVSKTVETTPIPFGRIVSAGSTDEKIIIGGSEPQGMTLRHQVMEYNIPEVGDRIGILQEGPVHALVNGAGSLGDELKYDTVTGQLTTAAVAGNVIAFPAGRVVLKEDKIANSDVDLDIATVEITGLFGTA